MTDLLKALAGLVLVFTYHLPRLIFHALLVSYAAVFANVPTLTADPAEHLRRATVILKRGRLSELLYAALEIRFAVERMTHRELVFAEMASKRMRDEYDPTKHLAHLHRLAPEAAFAHEIYLVNKATGERFRLAEYKPLDKARVAEIKGRLGNLLHPSEGLWLGIPSDPWYLEAKAFLAGAVEYLAAVQRDNTPFFSYHGLEQFDMVRAE